MTALVRWCRCIGSTGRSSALPSASCPRRNDPVGAPAAMVVVMVVVMVVKYWC
jgi:hypothetical protein